MIKIKYHEDTSAISNVIVDLAINLPTLPCSVTNHSTVNITLR